MVVLDQFYQIVEAKTSHVSIFWKVAHTCACIVSAVCGFLTAFTFGRVLDNFDYNCVLNANIVFDNNTYLNSSEFPNHRVRAMDLTETMWGHPSQCNFAQFTPLVIMISAVLWGTYFVIMSRGGAGYATDVLSKAWTIVYPCFIFTFIFFIVYVISTKRLEDGIIAFCRQFEPEFQNKRCIPEIDMYSDQFGAARSSLFFKFYPNIKVALMSSEVGIWSWIFQIVLCVLRVFSVADFDLQLVTITLKEEETVEKIVDFAGGHDDEDK